MEFKDFLIKEFGLSEKSATDYVGRFNGLVKRGIYNGEQAITPRIRKEIESEFPNSKKHYILAFERYVKYKQNT
ncbi:hypothetical protein ACFFIS_06810 [Virgibacillus soli]|uniref:Core-binding (CB) domain-containing protein n=1 Tax=Paracerasibacillus soli TaxID=480284 RepID=A0ABU5CP62_9BACI|nr:hypothetical protein [Virgibacillus soli]MDY0407666.1 hypothetical protein [Virgibacillus soli]